MTDADTRDASVAILDAIPAWVLVVDADMVVRFANRSYLDSQGTDFAGVSGRPLADVFLPGRTDTRGMIAAVRESLEVGGTPIVRYFAGIGLERALDLRVSRIRVFGGEHRLLVLHDVTEHWAAREAASRSKQKLEEIVNGMGASLVVLDSDLRVVWANRTFREWFGEIWGEKFDHALRGLILGGDTDPHRIFTEGEHVSKEWAHFTPAGEKRYYRNLILPGHDAKGELEELVLVTQDLTEVTLRAEQHRLLRELANLLQSTLDLDRLIYIILTCATAGHALGFNRAFIFLTKPEGHVVSGMMGVGPSSQEEAFTIWADLASSRKSLADLTADFEEFQSAGEGPLTKLVSGLHYDLSAPHAEREVIVRTVVEDETQLVRDSWKDARVTPEFRGLFPAREFVSVPLRAKGRVVGALLADNVYSRSPISADQVEILELFAAHAGLALDNSRTYEQLKESMQRVQEARDTAIQSERLATVGRLAAHVAHEIRNPLVTIGGFARSIRKKSKDASRVRTSAGIILEEVERLENILSGVMDFARPAKLEPIVYSVNDLVSRLVPKLEGEMQERGIEIVCELDPGVPSTSFDIAQIHQVLLNLVRNAADAYSDPDWVPDGEREKKIVIRTFRGEKTVVIEVCDFGPGVPEDLLPSLFEPFITRKVGGTGLGLAVVRKILLDHGGNVSVRSRPGEGATFVLELPLKPPAATLGNDDGN